MTRIEEFAATVDDEGLEYAIRHYDDYKDVEDPILASDIQKFEEISERIEKRLSLVEWDEETGEWKDKVTK